MSKKLIKILYITNGITGSGGLERVLSVKTAALDEQYDYDIHIMVLNEPIDKEPFFPYSTKIKRHCIDVSGNPVNYIYQYIKGVKTIIKKVQPNIISVCDDGFKAFFLPIMLSKKIPMIYERHAAINLNYENNTVIRKLKKSILHNMMIFGARYYDSLIVLTKGNIKDWRLKQVKVISNPIPFNVSEVSALTSKKIIAVGSHSQNKGTDLLLNIWEIVQDIKPDWNLEIYGKSAEGNRYEEIAKRKKLKNISFYPPTDEIKQKYLNSSIFILPSRSEGFGMVLIEAMACGLPCIAFDVPHGPADIISHDVDGFLIQDGKIKSFADKIIFLIEHDEVRKKMGQAARKKANNYLLNNIIPLWDQLFNDLLKYIK